jgi:hypothetical protein
MTQVSTSRWRLLKSRSRYRPPSCSRTPCHWDVENSDERNHKRRAVVRLTNKPGLANEYWRSFQFSSLMVNAFTTCLFSRNAFYDSSAFSSATISSGNRRSRSVTGYRSQTNRNRESAYCAGRRSPAARNLRMAGLVVSLFSIAWQVTLTVRLIPPMTAVLPVEPPVLLTFLHRTILFSMSASPPFQTGAR